MSEFLLSINDLNLIAGMGWDKPGNTEVTFKFNKGGETIIWMAVTVGIWEYCIGLSKEPPQMEQMVFHLSSLREVLREIEESFKNPRAVLNMKMNKKQLEIVGGPGNGLVIRTIYE